jgi:hypothetical protein
LPNIDINNNRVSIPSWSKAKRLLSLLCDEYVCFDYSSIYLSSFTDQENGDDFVLSLDLPYVYRSPTPSAQQSWWVAFQIAEMVHPPWWAKRGKPVPTFDQLIASSGPSNIGIHLDTYGDGLKPVDTYITIVYGTKLVLMIPPTEESKLFFQKNENATFPEFSEVKNEIQQLNGYLFEISGSEDEPMTILIPMGWYHWIENKTKWSLIISASQF